MGTRYQVTDAHQPAQYNQASAAMIRLLTRAIPTPPASTLLKSPSALSGSGNSKGTIHSSSSSNSTTRSISGKLWISLPY